MWGAIGLNPGGNSAGHWWAGGVLVRVVVVEDVWLPWGMSWGQALQHHHMRPPAPVPHPDDGHPAEPRQWCGQVECWILCRVRR